MITVCKVESLAKLYLESKPAEISDTMIAELCDWVWGECQVNSLSRQCSWYAYYNNAREIFSDIQQRHLWMSAEDCNTTFGLHSVYSFIFQAMHDDDDYPTRNDSSLEIATYNVIAKRVPSLNVQKMIYSPRVLRSAAYLFLGYMLIAKMVYP